MPNTQLGWAKLRNNPSLRDQIKRIFYEEPNDVLVIDSIMAIGPTAIELLKTLHVPYKFIVLMIVLTTWENFSS